MTEKKQESDRLYAGLMKQLKDWRKWQQSGRRDTDVINGRTK